jgi:hypothetical protein
MRESHTKSGTFATSTAILSHDQSLAVFTVCRLVLVDVSWAEGEIRLRSSARKEV